MNARRIGWPHRSFMSRHPSIPSRTSSARTGLEVVDVTVDGQFQEQEQQGDRDPREREIGAQHARVLAEMDREQPATAGEERRPEDEAKPAVVTGVGVELRVRHQKHLVAGRNGCAGPRARAALQGEQQGSHRQHRSSRKFHDCLALPVLRSGSARLRCRSSARTGEDGTAGSSSSFVQAPTTFSS